MALAHASYCTAGCRALALLLGTQWKDHGSGSDGHIRSA